MNRDSVQAEVTACAVITVVTLQQYCDLYCNKSFVDEFAFVAAPTQSHPLRFKLFKACSSRIAHWANLDSFFSIFGKFPEYPAVFSNVFRRHFLDPMIMSLFSFSLFGASQIPCWPCLLPIENLQHWEVAKTTEYAVRCKVGRVALAKHHASS